ncbi:MAG: SDR family oxidoreductase [Propionibacteriaceae bacterium]|jgi:3-oxoacyl-[acyl-carrier protein] reductase|nr:SDR family oxidoreductase [Propionibacteriaceae bacterium]
MSEQDLNGHVALITGSSSGIGRATVLAFAARGASVVGVARSDDALGAAVAELGGDYVQVRGDVRCESTATAAVQEALERYGHIDTLVNGAGVGQYDDFVNATAELYDEIMDTSMRGTFLFTAATVPHMIARHQGTIIQVASQAGLQGFPREAVYCAAKHAQVGFSRSLRRELQPHGIKVGVVCPAAVLTEFAHGRGRDDEFLSHTDYFLAATDLAAAILFMATQSPNSRVTEMALISLGEAL